MVPGVVRLLLLASLILVGCGEDPLAPIANQQLTDPDGIQSSGNEPATTVPNNPPPKPKPKPTIDPEPDPDPGICELIEARAGSCPGYGYDCPSRPEAQSWCFYDMLLGLQDPCMVFADGQLCNWATGEVTLYGLASCFMQECFELTDANACVSNMQILCAFP